MSTESSSVGHGEAIDGNRAHFTSDNKGITAIQAILVSACMRPRIVR